MTEPALRPDPPGLGVGEPDGPRPRPLGAELLLLWRHRDLLLAFASNDLRHRYVGSSIGFFWTVVNPIVELVTYTFVFHVLMGVTFHPSGGTVHYSLFLFCGMVAWFSVSEGLTRATTSITDHAHLIKKVNFPAAVLPGYVVVSAVFNQLVRTVILAVGVIFLGNGLSWHFLLVPIFIAIQAAFVMGLGFFLATANAYFRDAAHWVNAILLGWMFITPIFYPPAAYPREFQLLLQLNPLAHIVGVYQELILNQRLPHPRQMMLTVMFAGFAFVIGYSIFAHHRRRFADLT
ncbi:MAG: ABC transporter permease [Alphaproteobacteria bacterium]|nr:ABC transporter permease [Alphaproteobacteria bacterium]MCB9793407.1 ABC transporter permease [Alphaproteobacteria bacterium]